MTFVVKSTDDITNAGMTLAANDQLLILDGVHVGGTDFGGTGIAAGGGNVIQVMGTVFGWLPIQLNGAGGNNVTITATGSVFGTQEGIEFHGAGNTLHNRGQIDGGSVAVAFADANSVVFNSGTIHTDGPNANAVAFLTGGSRVVNTGTISNEGVTTLGAAISASGSGDPNVVQNTGEIFGTHTAIDINGKVVNAGHIHGDIVFLDNADVYNGQSGYLDGTIFAGNGADLLKGGAGDEIFMGELGNDTLKGGAGDDILNGGIGADRLDGGAGEDTFVYAGVSDSRNTSHDTIIGFDPSEDVIDLNVVVHGLDPTPSGPATVNAVSIGTDLAGILGPTQLLSRHATMLFVTGGNLSGHTLLVVDGNNVSGFQAGGDYVFDMKDAVNLFNLTIDNFV